MHHTYIVYIVDYTLVKHTGNMLRIADKSKSKQSKDKYYAILHIVFYIVQIGVREMSLEH